MVKSTAKNFYIDYILSPKEKNRGSKSGHKKWWLILVFVVALLVVVIVFSINKIKSSKVVFDKWLYLVVVGKFGNIADAKDLADNVEISGGAGYIWVEDTFWVVAFVYPTKEAADNVSSQLKATSWKSSVEKIELKKPKKAKLKNSQNNAVDLLWQMLNDFYNFAIEVDTKENQNAKVHKNLTDIKQQIKSVQNKLQDTDIDLCLKESLAVVYDELDGFLKASFPKNLYSSGIKLLCVKTAQACSSLYGQLEKLL